MESLEERVIRLEEKHIAAKDALELARGKLDRASVISAITIIVSIIALFLQWMKK